MPFVMTMAWRETRAAWRHFLYFFFCIALGVGTLVGVGLFAANVERAVAREARGLMGGDLEIRLTRPISANGQEILRSLERRGIDVLHVSELVAMASRLGAQTSPSPPSYAVPTQVIELKAIEPSYPFYGTLKTDPSHPVSQLIGYQAGGCTVTGRVQKTDCYGAIVQDSLLIKMGLQVGDELRIGQAVLTITGTLKHEPDRVATAFSLGPRVMMSQEALRSADLVKPGSRVRERYLLRLPSEVQLEHLLTELRDRLAGDSAQVSTFREAQPQLRRFLEHLTRYLGLVGLTALFVGGIGVASTIHAFVKDKLKTIAILKTLGADSGTVIRTYLVQALCLGILGSLAGVTLGVSLQHAIPTVLAGLVPIDLLDLSVTQGSLFAEPVLKGLAMGAATTLLFTLWPLLGIREVRPALIFRTEIVGAAQDDDRQGRITWREHLRHPVRWVTIMLVGIGLSALAMWQARSIAIGMIFIVALIAAVMLLTLAAAMVMRWLRIIPSPSSLMVRHAMRNLSRPGSQATSIMVAVGIGVMIIVTISLLERSLISQIGESRPLNAPTFFFIDVQPDQKAAFERLIHQRFSHVTPELTPLVRSRLHAVNGQPVPIHEEDEGERGGRRNGEHGKSWYFTREYVLTFLDRLPKENVVVQGQWWTHPVNTQGALVSVEEDAARHLGINPGSTIEFDIQGTVVPATVSSIRKVEWNNFSTNFYMILSPGSLEDAPFTFVATVRVSPAEEVPLQQAVVEAFPNVTAINIGEVMDTFARVLEHLSVAIRTIAVFCMLAGALVMAAALATTRYRRLYESVVFKALGATRLLIAGSFATEYAFMGTVAGLIGTVLASVLSWGVLYFVFDLPWGLHPGVLISGLLLTMVLTLAVGFLSTFRILGQRPLAILRHE
jgi:putative ABC transport system permease protein